MASIREVRTKIKSVRQTQQVTKAMKMISAARFKRAQSALFASRPYAYKVGELMQDIASRLSAEGKTLPELFRTRTNALDRVLLVFTSDKGLCGAFNVVALREVLKFYEETASRGGKTHFFVVGKKGRDFLARQGFPIVKEFTGFSRNPNFAQADILYGELMNFYKATPSVGEIVSLYTQFKSIMKYQPALNRLVPHVIETTARPKTFWDRFDFVYEPPQEVILEALLPRAIKVEIYRHLLETLTSEQASRMNVMENATRNAGDLIDSLALLANKIRQAAITREILEVVSGAEAIA